MAENPKLADMGTQKISVSEQTNSLQFTNFKSDSFVVDMERLSHLTDKDITANSRFTLQRNLSRKLSQQRGSEKKINPSIGNENDNGVVSTSSPRATLTGASTPEKPMVVTVGTSTDQPKTPHLHHQITIMTGNIGATTTESRGSGKRFSFRRSPYSWAVDPRRIVFLFATLSSMGTILLIYFTLSMGKISGDDSAMNV
ncbi:hypothetical protein CsSME_00030766 [Camellia sinensis var. sinensis]